VQKPTDNKNKKRKLTYFQREARFPSINKFRLSLIYGIDFLKISSIVLTSVTYVEKLR